MLRFLELFVEGNRPASLNNNKTGSSDDIFCVGFFYSYSLGEGFYLNTFLRMKISWNNVFIVPTT